MANLDIPHMFLFRAMRMKPFSPHAVPQLTDREKDPQITNNEFIFTPLEVSRAHTETLELTLLYKQI